MKRSKGFTLVELLAVIAILAILIIIAIPNVLKMYNSARKGTFNNELNTLIKVAKEQYLYNGGEQIYSSDSNPLDLTGNGSLDYCIKLDSQGQIIEMEATNGVYKYESDGIVESINSNEISKAESNYTINCRELSPFDPTLDPQEQITASYTITLNAFNATIPSTSGWTISNDGHTATKTINSIRSVGTLPTLGGNSINGHSHGFDGWYTEPNGGTKITSSSFIESDLTLYARWSNLKCVSEATGWVCVPMGDNSQS